MESAIVMYSDWAQKVQDLKQMRNISQQTRIRRGKCRLLKQNQSQDPRELYNAHHLRHCPTHCMGESPSWDDVLASHIG